MLPFECPLCRARFDLAPVLTGERAKCPHCLNVSDLPWIPSLVAEAKDGHLCLSPGAAPPLSCCLNCGTTSNVVVRLVTQSWINPLALLPGFVTPMLAPVLGAFFTRTAFTLIPECDSCVSGRRRRRVALFAGSAVALPVFVILFGILGEFIRKFIPTRSAWHDEAFWAGLVAGFIAWTVAIVYGFHFRHGRRTYMCVRIDDEGVLLKLPSRGA